VDLDFDFDFDFDLDFVFFVHDHDHVDDHDHVRRPGVGCARYGRSRGFTSRITRPLWRRG
jgi:hypothetical protein